MHILVLGVSYRTAPIELRERLDFSARGLERALDALAARPACSEAVALSTCNRAEVYAGCSDVAPARRDLIEFFSEFHGIAPDDLAPHLYDQVDADAARHLFRVAASLDSLVVGEPQILGQVKEAYAAATERHCAGPLLNKLFHWAFAAGKRVRAETGLSEGAVSVGYAAVALARKIFGGLVGRRVLVIGSGEMGKLTALRLRSQGIERVAITGRTAARVEALASAIEAGVVSWDDRLAAIADADIVIAATGSSAPIVTRGQIAGVMRARRHRPLFIIDIAVPRDVEPAAGELEHVFLYNIDDLQAIVRENLSKRSGEIARAEEIVDEEVGRYAAWLRSREAIPTVVALRQRFEAIRQAELRRLEPKLALLSSEARARIDEVTRLIVEKLLLTPTEQLKAIPDRETVVAYSDALSRLFSLSAQEVAVSEPGRAAEELASMLVAGVDAREAASDDRMDPRRPAEDPAVT